MKQSSNSQLALQLSKYCSFIRIIIYNFANLISCSFKGYLAHRFLTKIDNVLYCQELWIRSLWEWKYHKHNFINLPIDLNISIFIYKGSLSLFIWINHWDYELSFILQLRPHWQCNNQVAQNKNWDLNEQNRL